jgi:hypothetical protein
MGDVLKVVYEGPFPLTAFLAALLFLIVGIVGQLTIPVLGQIRAVKAWRIASLGLGLVLLVTALGMQLAGTPDPKDPVVSAPTPPMVWVHDPDWLMDVLRASAVPGDVYRLPTGVLLAEDWKDFLNQYKVEDGTYLVREAALRGLLRSPGAVLAQSTKPHS